MKKILLIAIIIFTGFYAKAQKTQRDTSQIYNDVDKLPEFPGGGDAFKNYVNLDLKKTVRKDTSPGMVIVSFVVEKDGSLSNPKATMGLNSEADLIAIKIIGKSPKWKPAVKDGKVVRCKFSVPVKFGQSTDGPPSVKEQVN